MKDETGGRRVIFTAYLDETETHGPAPNIIIAGFVANEYPWRLREKSAAVQVLLGHSKIESTVRYLGIEVDDAIDIAEKIDI